MACLRLYSLKVFELQLRIYYLFVAQRIDRTGHVHHIVVVEAAKHMDNSIRLADIGKELVAQPFTFAGALDQTGYIYYLHGGWYDSPFGVTHLAETYQTLVRNGDDTYVGLNGTKRKVSRLGFGIAKAIKEC